VPIKTTANQACRSDGLSTKIKNLIAFLSFEPQVNTLGVSANFFDEPQVSDLSFPIVNDMNATDFSGGMMLYFRKYLFVTAPADGKVFVYNMTQDVTDGLVDTSRTHFWEAPQLMAISRLAIIGGELYGHSSLAGNTFRLFAGTDDDGEAIDALALLAYDTYGDRTQTKKSDTLFLEGYKLQSTKLTAYVRRNVNGPVSAFAWRNLPDACVTPPVDDASIGKQSVGSSPIGGGELGDVPRFRLKQTYAKLGTDCSEEQIGFGSDEVGAVWRILSCATNAVMSVEQDSAIKDPPLAND